MLLRYHPNDVAALLQLAIAEQQGGKLERAQVWIERAIALDPTSSLLLVTCGEILYHRGLSADALRVLQRAVELSPANHDAFYLMGFVLGDLGRQEEARSATRRAVQLNPALSRPHANLSLESIAGDEATELGMTRTRELQVAPDAPLAHYNLGLAFRRKGYYAEALTAYHTALDRGEERTLVLQAMAEVHLLRRDPQQARPLYEQLLVEQPENPKLWNELGVAFHQEGRLDDALASYRRAITAEAGYVIAHNNLAVAHYQRGAVDAAASALGAALEAQPGFAKARLNLALLLVRGRRYAQALDMYRQVLGDDPAQPVAWNGVGVVLAELRKFEDARNAFARAIQARPAFAEAHYNMSFALSNLGDFEGALRETKRALELDPYYVPQKLALAIDVEYEDPDLAVPPDLGTGDRRDDTSIEDFEIDSEALDLAFRSLVSVPATPVHTGIATPTRGNRAMGGYGMATDYLSKGLYDRATAEVGRALARGAPRGEGLALLGNVFSRQGLHGEALERFREARRLDRTLRAAAVGEAWSLIKLSRAREARPIADGLLTAAREDVDVLMLAATASAESGDPAAALSVLDVARRVAPMRADVQQAMGDIARSVGDNEGAIAAYQHALQLDAGFAMVRFKLARVLEDKGLLRDAEAELVAALDSVPTFADATLALAALRRRVGRYGEAMDLLIDLLQRDPYHLDALTCLGETLRAANRPADAAIAFGRVLRFDSGHAAALLHHGLLLADHQRFREAIAAWQRVIELHPASPHAKRARREIRTATDLVRVLGDRINR